MTPDMSYPYSPTGAAVGLAFIGAIRRPVGDLDRPRLSQQGGKHPPPSPPRVAEAREVANWTDELLRAFAALTGTGGGGEAGETWFSGAAILQL